MRYYLDPTDLVQIIHLFQDCKFICIIARICLPAQEDERDSRRQKATLRELDRDVEGMSSCGPNTL